MHKGLEGERPLTIKTEMMRIYMKIFGALTLAFLTSAGLFAQYDDIYFDSDEADEVYAAIEEEELVREYGNNERGSTVAAEDAYDYYYTSRIRRFDRPFYGFDFYSPAYVDRFYYDPFYPNFYRPGANIYVSTGWGFVPAGGAFTSVGWGWGNPAWSTWNRPVWGAPAFGGPAWGSPWASPGFGTFVGGPVGFAPVGVGGFGGVGGFNAYCPPQAYAGVNTGFVPNPTGTVNRPAPRGTYYGPRSTGSSNTSPTSPRGNNGSVNAPDRPLVADNPATRVSPRTGTTTTRPTSASPRDAASTHAEIRSRPTNVPRDQRPVYTGPQRSTINTRATRTSQTRERFTAPSRPSRSTYSPSSSNRFRNNSPRSYSPSTRSSSRSFSSPRSSSSIRSSSTRSVSPRSSGGGSRSPR